jgi:energy-coupling factor transporter ATP-binding protein EcfA2
VNQPAIILADEPTGNLDSQTSVEIMRILQALHAEWRMTIVLVTHEPDITRYAGRVIVFKDGLVIEDRPVTDREFAGKALVGSPHPTLLQFGEGKVGDDLALSTIGMARFSQVVEDRDHDL